MSEDKRQDDELELAPDAGDEDLMSDFKELFPEDETADDSAEANGRDAAEALDELDAFLDDFEQGFDPSGDKAEIASSSEEDESRQLQLEDDELDLAVSEASDDVAFGDDWGPDGEMLEDLAEGEVPEQTSVPEPVPPAQQELDVSTDEVAAVAGSASAVSAASAAAMFPDEAKVQGGTPGRGVVLALAGTLLIAVVLSGAALWIGFGTGGRLDAMEQRLSDLQQRGGGAPNAQLQAELRNLTARVNELAVIIEGPISHLRQSSEESLAALEQRLTKLEQGVTSAPAAAPASARKLVEKVPAPRNVSATVTKSSARNPDNGWVINLVSLRSEKDAQEEMVRLRKAGVRVEMQRAQTEGKTWYRLRVPGFTSYEGAKAYIDTVEKQAGVKNAWVAKQ